MAGIVTLLLFMFAGGGGSDSAFTRFYNEYFNIPGFELWKFINLALFVSILTYLLKRPLSEAFKARREVIRAELIKAEEEKKAALAELAETEAKLAALEAKKEEIIKSAQADIDFEKKRLAEQTRIDIERMRLQTEAEVARCEGQTRAELRRFSAEESIRLAEEKLRARIDDSIDVRLVRSSIEKIGGLN